MPIASYANTHNIQDFPKHWEQPNLEHAGAGHHLTVVFVVHQKQKRTKNAAAKLVQALRQGCLISTRQLQLTHRPSL